MNETLADKRRRKESAIEAPPCTNTVLIVRDRDGQLHIRKDHRNAQGQEPRYYVTTGYKAPLLPTVWAGDMQHTKPIWSTPIQILYGRNA